MEAGILGGVPSMYPLIKMTRVSVVVFLSGWPIGAHRGPCLSAPYVFAIFSKFLQWVVLLVKSLKHLGPCPIAPAASLKDINNRAGLFQTSIFRISL